MKDLNNVKVNLRSQSCHTVKTDVLATYHKTIIVRQTTGIMEVNGKRFSKKWMGRQLTW